MIAHGERTYPNCHFCGAHTHGLTTAFGGIDWAVCRTHYGQRIVTPKERADYELERADQLDIQVNLK